MDLGKVIARVSTRMRVMGWFVLTNQSRPLAPRGTAARAVSNPLTSPSHLSHSPIQMPGSITANPKGFK